MGGALKFSRGAIGKERIFVLLIIGSSGGGSLIFLRQRYFPQNIFMAMPPPKKTVIANIDNIVGLSNVIWVFFSVPISSLVEEPPIFCKIKVLIVEGGVDLSGLI